MVCIDKEIPFEIPNGWEWCRLGQLCTVFGRIGFRGYTKADMVQEGKGAISISPSNMNDDGSMHFHSNTYISWFKYDESPEIKIRENDILVVKTGSSYGKTCVVPRLPQKATINPQIAVLKYIGCNNVYLSSVLSSPNSRRQFERYVLGTSIPTFSQERLSSTIIPLPPLSEQNRIVDLLKTMQPLVNQYNKLHVNLEELNASVKSVLRKSILQEAIQGKLVAQDASDEPASVLFQRIREEKLRLVKEGKLKKKDVIDSTIFRGDDNKYYEQISDKVVEITEDIPFDVPEGWSWCRLKSICTIFTGATFKKEEANTGRTGIRILRGGNILPFEITFKADDIFLPYNAIKENILLRKNDIVTPAVTSLENIGKMARVKDDLPDVTVGGFVFVLRLYFSNECLSQYLLALMSSPTIIEYMKSITNKSGQAFYNIGKERLATTLLPIPPLSEQQRIVNQIEKIFSEIKGN